MPEWLYSEDIGMLMNTDRVDDVYIDYKACKLMAAVGTSRYHLAEYATGEQCDLALSRIMNRLGQGGCIIVPTAEKMEWMTRTKDHERARNGKKTVRRGGS